MNLSAEFEPVNRPLTHYVFIEKHGPFAEVATALERPHATARKA
jgi:hypothetical protein